MIDLTGLITMGPSAMMNGGLGGLLALGMFAIFFAFLLLLAFYIFGSLAWMTIGKKLNYQYPWLAWIPFANGAMILQMGGFHWAWMFLILLPIIGWIPLGVISFWALWRIYEKRSYPGWLALIPLGGFIPYIGWMASIGSLVILGLVAWSDRAPLAKSAAKPIVKKSKK